MSDCIVQKYVKRVNVAKNNRGQGLVEYALILLLVALLVIVAVKGIGNTTNNFYSSVNSGLTNK